MKNKLSDVASRVASRSIEAMSVVLRNVAGQNWGFFSNEDKRMHLQTVSGGSRSGHDKVKVWLESRGKRIFELAEGNPKKSELNTLADRVEVDRESIEDKWTIFMIDNDWVKAEIKDRVVTVTAYPNSHNNFIRKINLSQYYPGAYPRWDTTRPKLDLKSSPGLLAVGPNDNPDDRNHILLSEVLFGRFSKSI
jgi:hypothetical protein